MVLSIIFLLKRDENTLYICQNGSGLKVASYGDDEKYIMNILGGNLSDFGIGVGFSRRIFILNRGSYFNMICDGKYIYIRYSSH